ncbi:DNA alkylation repair protein [Mitsuaria sp. GD03876]|uniref:DNA alkylation repair protein n=1 Tax=Mitsuaria sp. GD03876 TaxID=2975399 RepID=UPI00244D5087|nr:DNA alkylation repair protein [Mitsuaria sp. GD03876]MDH0865299.1 DNA alkylation repair protein [Mitsuaria sp. GD03876]
MTDTTPDAAPNAGYNLKDLIGETALRALADVFADTARGFDRRRFLAAATEGLEPLSIMQRVHRVAEALAVALPGRYGEQLDAVVAAAPTAGGAFINMGLCDFVASHGLHDPAASLQALERLTPHGTAEFAIRPFLRQDLAGTLAVMARWTAHPDEHVRRLASEGCRPRLPWSFRLDALVADPAPLARILDALRADDSLYVRRSVANNLNDITKDHADWVFARLADWDLGDERSAWIVKHALRSRIKQGDARALKLIGASEGAEAVVEWLTIQPARVALGGEVEIAFALRSTAQAGQRLVVDYAVHYVKKNGRASPKVFKLKTVELAAGESAPIRIRRALRDFTTRTHYAGTHAVEVLVNGQRLAGGAFELTVD